MRERLERTVAEIEAARRNARVQEAAAEVPAPASPPAEAPRVDPDVVRALQEQLMAIGQRIDRLDVTLKSIDSRVNPGVSHLEQRFTNSMQQVTIMLGVVLLVLLAVGILVVMRG